MHLLLNQYNKIILDDNGSFSDFSDSMRRWNSDTLPLTLVPDEDYLYIGAPHSFAARYLKFDEVNDVSASLKVEYYAGENNGWKEVKNLADETKIGGKPFAKNGFISWDLPTDWATSQVDGKPEYPDNGNDQHNGYYWVRISSSVELNALTAIQWLGLIWTNEEFMLRRWREVKNTRYLPTGQTDWYEEIELATKDVANDMNINNLIDYELQAKDISEMANITALKTLINILIPLRHVESLQQMRKDFQDLYDQAMRVRFKGIDKNKNEKLDGNEEETISNVIIKRF